MAATLPKTSKLAASVGLTDDDLLGMYRTIALARAVDERMWVLNRAGRIPFVISGQGHEGAQVAIAWACEVLVAHGASILIDGKKRHLAEFLAFTRAPEIA